MTKLGDFGDTIESGDPNQGLFLQNLTKTMFSCFAVWEFFLHNPVFCSEHVSEKDSR